MRWITLDREFQPSSSDVLDRLSAYDTRALTAGWVRRHAESHAGLAVEIASRLTGDGLSLDEIVGCLRGAEMVANTFSTTDVRSVLEFSLREASRAVDPYSSEQVIPEARDALAAVFIVRPEVDDWTFELVATLPVLDQARALEVLAGALARRPTDGGRSVRKLLNHFGEAHGHLTLCRQANRRVAPEVSSSPSEYSILSNVFPFARKVFVFVGGFLVGPVVAAAVGAYTYFYLWQSPPATPGLPEAIAAITLFATIVVFTTQLSASRLPGPISRVAGLPAPTALGFGSSIGIMTLASYPGRDSVVVSATSWARLVLVAVFTLASALVVAQGITQTDPAQAVKNFGKYYSTACRSAGLQLGELHAEALKIKGAVSSLIGVEAGLPSQLVGTRERVFAQRSGLLIPSRRALSRLSERDSIKDAQIRIVLLNKFGVRVMRGTEIGALVPSSTARVNISERRSLVRALRLRGARGAEEVPRSILSVLSLAISLAKDHDLGSAEFVGGIASDLLFEHVKAVRYGRERALEGPTRSKRARPRPRRQPSSIVDPLDDEIYPVVPALEMTINFLVSEGMKGDALVWQLASSILRVILLQLGRLEYPAALVLVAVENAKGSGAVPDERAMDLVHMAGLRSLELDHNETLTLVRQHLRRAAASSASVEAHETASILAALSCWLTPRFAETWWALVEELEAGIPAEVAGVRIGRVGAAAVASGANSTALLAASAVLKISATEVVLGLARRDESANREVYRSEQSGGYLGATARDALEDFADFAADVGAKVNVNVPSARSG